MIWNAFVNPRTTSQNTLHPCAECLRRIVSFPFTKAPKAIRTNGGKTSRKNIRLLLCGSVYGAREIDISYTSLSKYRNDELVPEKNIKGFKDYFFIMLAESVREQLKGKHLPAKAFGSIYTGELALYEGLVQIKPDPARLRLMTDFEYMNT